MTDLPQKTEPFEILRIDAVTSGSSNDVNPMLYFVPTLELINYIRLNDNLIRINITGNDYYNGTKFAIIDQSSMTPNVRPNFYDATILYVATLYNTQWKGYPTNMGSFTINDEIAKPESIQTLVSQETKSREDKSVENKSVENNKDSYLNLSNNNSESSSKTCSKDDKLSSLELILIVFIIFLILFLIFGGIFYFKKKNISKKFN